MDKTADPKQNKTDKHNSQKKDPDPYGKMDQNGKSLDTDHQTYDNYTMFGDRLASNFDVKHWPPGELHQHERLDGSE